MRSLLRRTEGSGRSRLTVRWGTFALVLAILTLTWVAAGSTAGWAQMQTEPASLSEASGVPVAAKKAPGTVLWSTTYDMGGGNCNYVATTAVGSNLYYGMTGTDASGNWYGAIAAFNQKTGAYKWGYNIKLGGSGTQGTYVTSISASGSQVYVAGYAWINGVESAFVQAYPTNGKKGAKWTYAVAAPGADASNFSDTLPVGIVAKGSYVIGFYNIMAPGPKGKLFSLNTKTGVAKWEIDFEPSSIECQVNALAISGSRFAVAGGVMVASGSSFYAGGYFAKTGNSEWSAGTTGNGADNTALAISYSGSTIAAAGFLSNPGGDIWGHIEVLGKNGGQGGVIREDFSQGTPTKFTGVLVSGSKVYVTGSGGSPQFAFTRCYDTKKKTLLWQDDIVDPGPLGTVPTGLVATSSALYVAGYGFNGSKTDLFVKAYKLSGKTPETRFRWVNQFDMASGFSNKALAITKAGSNIVVVGQSQTGADTYLALDRGYVP
jgi:outer membrane protein assembly factor BamB